MADLGALRRRWQQTGNSADHAKFLLALLQGGFVSREALRAAAALGHAGALATDLSPAQLPGDYQERIEVAARALRPRTAVRFAHDCAVRVVAAWERVRPSDPRPTSALHATGLWLDNAVDTASLERASQAASDAAIAAHHPEFTEDMDPTLAKAVHAANAASHAALAAECAGQPGEDDVAEAAAYVASLAASAADHPASEQAWQIDQTGRTSHNASATPSLEP